MKHFIALVKMGGVHTGKIGQHSTHQETKQDAEQWAKNRFNRPAVVVDMNEHGNTNSLSDELATTIYDNETRN